jgi:acetyl-CoA synthetase
MTAAAQRYPALAGARVMDAMHAGLISCSPEASLRTVARMLAAYRVHTILVMSHGDADLSGGRVWGAISDHDLLSAAELGDLDDQTAGGIAASPVLTVAATDDLALAVGLMEEQKASHMVVVDGRSGQPVGVLSTLDAARALAGTVE